MKRLGDRPYRVGDTVRVVSTDPRWRGQVGTVKSAKYEEHPHCPLVVDLPDAPECPKGVGICFTTASVELVDPVDPKLERIEDCRVALCRALNDYVSPDQAARFLASEWLKNFVENA